jgi:UDPglucose 6-dehydrogenase
MAQIATVGLWHLGSVASACLASLGHQVRGTDFDVARVWQLSAGSPPLFEPGLAESIAEQSAAGRLSFRATCREAFEGAEYIFFTFDTPVDEDDRSNLEPIERAFEEVAAHAPSGITLVLMSQVPVGSSARLSSELAARAPRLNFSLVYQPENLRLGEALDTFLRPDFFVVGAEEAAAVQSWEKLYESVSAPRLVMRWSSAELSKHALNAFLATSISFVNELADLAEICGADIREVTSALRRDRRIGPQAFLRPGPGFAGGTLGRDVQALRELGARGQRPTPQMDATLLVNRGRPARLAEKLEQACGNLSGRRIALLGLTYKPGTSTLRRSHALEIARLLAARGAEIAACDPQIRQTLPETRGIRLCADAYEAADGADAVALLTPWPEFRALDLVRLRAAARQPVLLDAHNFLDDVEARRAGWRYLGVGVGHTAEKAGEATA